MANKARDINKRCMDLDTQRDNTGRSRNGNITHVFHTNLERNALDDPKTTQTISRSKVAPNICF